MKTCQKGHQYRVAGKGCLQCKNARSRILIHEKRKKTHPHILKGQNLKRTVWKGLTDKEAHDNYLEMMNAQAGFCAGCGVHRNELSEEFHVDHDHSTHVVRGLLCRTCNVLEGWLKRSKNISGLMAYMSRHDTYGI